MVKTAIVSWTHDVEEVIEEAYLLCQNRFSDMLPKTGKSKARIDRMWKDKHFDCFEEGSARIVATQLSRACTHQLVRHRLFSFKQLSMRSVEPTRLNQIIPSTICLTPGAMELYLTVFHRTRKAYRELRELGIPKEDARFIIPMGIETQIHITGNFRTWLHFLNMRTPRSRDPEETYRPGKGPQWEIRALAWECHEHLKKIAPNVFADRYKELWVYV